MKPSWAAMKLTLRVGLRRPRRRYRTSRQAVSAARRSCRGRRARSGGRRRGSGRSTRGTAAGNCRAGSRPGRCPRARRSARGRRARIALDRAAAAARRARSPAGAAEHGGEVEAEAVDAGIAARSGAGVEDQPPHGRVVAGEGVAGAGVVDEHGRIVGGVAVVGARCRGRAATASGRSSSLSPVWLKTTSRMTPMPASCSAATVVAQLGDAARRKARIERHEGDGIVAPGIGQPERRQMPLVDPGGDRHQLDGVDAELAADAR